jgi:hypothetical protein
MFTNKGHKISQASKTQAMLLSSSDFRSIASRRALPKAPLGRPNGLPPARRTYLPTFFLTADAALLSGVFLGLPLGLASALPVPALRLPLMTLESAAPVLAAFSVVGRKTSAGAAGGADDGDLKMVRGAALAFALALAAGGGPGGGGGSPEEDDAITGGSLGYLTVEAEDVLGAALALALAFGFVLGLTCGGSPLG